MIIALLFPRYHAEVVFGDIVNGNQAGDAPAPPQSESVKGLIGSGTANTGGGNGGGTAAEGGTGGESGDSSSGASVPLTKNKGLIAGLAIAIVAAVGAAVAAVLVLRRRKLRGGKEWEIGDVGKTVDFGDNPISKAEAENVVSTDCKAWTPWVPFK